MPKHDKIDKRLLAPGGWLNVRRLNCYVVAIGLRTASPSRFCYREEGEPKRNFIAAVLAKSYRMPDWLRRGGTRQKRNRSVRERFENGIHEEQKLQLFSAQRR